MTYDSLEQFPPGRSNTFAINVFSPFWLARALAGELARWFHHHHNLDQAYDPSRISSTMPRPGYDNLVVNLATELGGRHRVNVCAGPIWTPLIPSTMPPERVAGFGSDTPLGRASPPIEVAAAFVFSPPTGVTSRHRPHCHRWPPGVLSSPVFWQHSILTSTVFCQSAP